jgi:hypothetical protein
MKEHPLLFIIKSIDNADFNPAEIRYVDYEKKKE